MTNLDISFFLYSIIGNHTLSLLFTIRHNPGTHLANADVLSRLQLPDKPNFAPVPADVQLMFYHLSECIIHPDQIKKLTDQDPTLYRVQRIVETGHILLETSPEFKLHVQCYTELSVLQGGLLRGSPIIIPPQGRKTILSQLHDIHHGITRMKHLARAYI